MRDAVAVTVPPRRAAVLGSPISHSLSPVLHGAAYEALGLDGWRYDAYECDEAGLRGFVAGLGPEWAGLSLTMPLKRVAMEVADEVSPLAAAVGAANTLVLTPDGRTADNTDVAGLVMTLRGAQLRGGRAVLLGAGGTAQAALAALRELGVDEVAVLVRSVSRADELQAAAARPRRCAAPTSCSRRCRRGPPTRSARPSRRARWHWTPSTRPGRRRSPRPRPSAGRG